MKTLPIKWTARLASMGFCLLGLTACGPSDEQRARLEESRRIECLNKLCEGDVEPKRDMATEVALKLNGQWFIGPKEYFSTGKNGGGFYWSSRHPMFKGGEHPEGSHDFPAKAIEIFFRSNTIPAEPHGYKLIEMAQAQGWIASRTTLRPGLDAIKMKHVIGPRDQYIDHVTYYVATTMTGVDGVSPVATCNHDDPRNSGGTGFMWHPGIWVGTRMNQKHCADWPEIYLEITRVLQLLRKA